MTYDVTVDRDKFIGGSDISAIMGISTFKTRWQLLMEKAGLARGEFSGNKYTEFGNEIEPQIRDYINALYFTNFEPSQIIEGDFRGNTDGFNGECVLEIKSTSHIFDSVDEYIVYLVQLLKYMEVNKVKKGILAVYERNEDFVAEFDEKRLHIYEIDIDLYKDLLAQVNAEIDRFRADLKRLKGNPLLSEEDFQPNELVALSNEVMVLENRMAEYKQIEAEYKAMKDNLYKAMQEHNVKSWQTWNGVRITRVDEVKPTVSTVTELDEDALKTECPDIYSKYLKEKQIKTSSRKGSVRITFPKDKE